MPKVTLRTIIETLSSAGLMDQSEVRIDVAKKQVSILIGPQDARPTYENDWIAETEKRLSSG